ncbi:MAG: DUF1289 domain-containing protein [Pseudomonadota bacterium]
MTRGATAFRIATNSSEQTAKGVMGKKIPSPCIDVCKFRLQGRHCIGCSMTKIQKKMFKSLSKEPQQMAFIDLLKAQQAQFGRFRHWEPAYKRRCQKKGVKYPFK